MVISDPFLWIIGGSPFLYPRNFWKFPKYMYRICRICLQIYPLDVFGNGFIVCVLLLLKISGSFRLPHIASKGFSELYLSSVTHRMNAGSHLISPNHINDEAVCVMKLWWTQIPRAQKGKCITLMSALVSLSAQKQSHPEFPPGSCLTRNTSAPAVSTIHHCIMNTRKQTSWM